MTPDCNRLPADTNSFRPWIKQGSFVLWGLFWLGSMTGYVVSGIENHVPWCIPYLEGCTSVSRAGRYGTSFFIFKFTLIPAAFLMFVFWLDSWRWKKTFDPRHQWLNRFMVVCGCLGAILLCAHLVALGTSCTFCRTIRSYGTSGFFLCTFIAQWLLYVQVREFHPRALAKRVYLLICVWITLEIGLLILIPFLVEESRWIENGSAWRSSSIMAFAPVVIGCLWRISSLSSRE